MESIIASQTDHEITLSMKYYQDDINRFIFHQFAMYSRQKQPQKNQSAAEFLQMLLENVDKKTVSLLEKKKYINLVPDDVLVYMLSFYPMMINLFTHH